MSRFKHFLKISALISVVPLLLVVSYLNDVRIQKNAVKEVLKLGGSAHYENGLTLGMFGSPPLEENDPYQDYLHRVYAVTLQKRVLPPKTAKKITADDLYYVRQMKWLDLVDFCKVEMPQADLQTIMGDLPRTIVDHDGVTHTE